MGKSFGPLAKRLLPLVFATNGKKTIFGTFQSNFSRCFKGLLGPGGM
jgi:hypothetical protein